MSQTVAIVKALEPKGDLSEYIGAANELSDLTRRLLETPFIIHATDLKPILLAGERDRANRNLINYHGVELAVLLTTAVHGLRRQNLPRAVDILTDNITPMLEADLNGSVSIFEIAAKKLAQLPESQKVKTALLKVREGLETVLVEFSKLQCANETIRLLNHDNEETLQSALHHHFRNAAGWLYLLEFNIERELAQRQQTLQLTFVA